MKYIHVVDLGEVDPNNDCGSKIGNTRQEVPYDRKLYLEWEQ